MALQKFKYDHLVRKNRKDLDFVISAAKGSTPATDTESLSSQDSIQNSMAAWLDGNKDYNDPSESKKFFDIARKNWSNIHAKRESGWKLWQKLKVSNAEEPRRNDYIAFRYFVQELYTAQKLKWEQALPLMVWAEQHRHQTAYNRAEVILKNLGNEAFDRFARLMQNAEFESALNWLQDLVDGPHVAGTYFPLAHDEGLALLYHLINSHQLKKRFDDAWQHDPDSATLWTMEQAAHVSLNSKQATQDKDDTESTSTKAADIPVAFAAPPLDPNKIFPNDSIHKEWVILAQKQKKVPAPPVTNDSKDEKKAEATAPSPVVTVTTPELRVFASSSAPAKLKTNQNMISQSTRNIVNEYLQKAFPKGRNFQAEQYAQQGHGFWAKVAAATPAAIALLGAAYFLGLFAYGSVTLTLSTASLPVLFFPLVVIGALMATAALVSLTFTFLGRRAQNRAIAAERVLKQFKMGHLVLRDQGKEPSQYSFDWNKGLQDQWDYIRHKLETMLYQPHEHVAELTELLELLTDKNFLTIGQKKLKRTAKPKTTMALLHKMIGPNEYGAKLLRKPLEQQYRLLIEVIHYLRAEPHEDYVNQPKVQQALIALQEKASVLIEVLQTRVVQAQRLAYHKANQAYHRSSALNWGVGAGLSAILALTSIFTLPLLVGLVISVLLIAGTIVGGSMCGRAIKNYREAATAVINVEADLAKDVTVKSATTTTAALYGQPVPEQLRDTSGANYGSVSGAPSSPQGIQGQPPQVLPAEETPLSEVPGEIFEGASTTTPQ